MAEHTETNRPDRGQQCECQADPLAGLAEAIPVPVVLLTPEMHVRYANTALLQALGAESKHDLRETLPSQWLMRPQDDWPRIQALLREAVQSGNAPEPVRLSLQSADGAEIPAMVHARLLPELAGSSHDVLAVTFDTADRSADVESTIGNDPNGHAEQLRRSEERLKIIFEYAPDGYYLSDLRGNFVDGNRAAEQIVGYHREELIGKSFMKLNLLPKRQLPKAAKTLIKNRAGKPTGPEEFILNRKDGSQVTVEISTYPVEIQGETLVLGIARDLTERKRARRELKDSEARYRDLHEFSRDGCAATDLGGRIVESNTAFREMLGYSRGELKRLTYEDLTVSKWHASEAKIISNQVLTRGYSDLFEKELIRKDGTAVPVELRIYSRTDADGKPAGMWAIIRDVTERHRAEEQLRRAEEQFKVMTDSAQDAIMMMDPEGHVTFYNKTAQRMFEWTAAEAVGKDMHALLAPQRYHGAFHKGFAHFRHTGQGAAIGKTLELTALRKDGTEFPIEISLAGVELDDQWHAIGIVRDISERKKAERKLESLNHELHVAVDELERSNRELSDFAHITAHDLKAPLRGIDTLASWLSEDYAQQLDEQGQENLRLMRERIDRMVGLINGILTYSKIGRSDESVEVLDTRGVVEDVVDHIAPPDHIEVRIEGAFPHITAERTRLMQVFQNLIGNAIKYIDKPQGLVRVSARTRDDAWEFCIADNGPGIEAKHFDRIFQMFQTLSSSDRCDSTGLGLAVVKKIVGLYGGRVWLESELGQGSAFHFALPRTEEAAVGDPH